TLEDGPISEDLKDPVARESGAGHVEAGEPAMRDLDKPEAVTSIRCAIFRPRRGVF
ncbi:MAG: hypothetical protein Q9157_008736, partial [Trypethelium eluteriae]